jgi:hypothetical protein
LECQIHDCQRSCSPSPKSSSCPGNKVHFFKLHVKIINDKKALQGWGIAVGGPQKNCGKLQKIAEIAGKLRKNAVFFSRETGRRKNYKSKPGQNREGKNSHNLWSFFFQIFDKNVFSKQKLWILNHIL